VHPEPSGQDTEQSSAPPQLTAQNPAQSTMWQVAVLTQSREQPPPGQERTQESASVQTLAQLPDGQLISHAPTFVHSVLHVPWQF
jgi:hypothetical protein